MTSQPVAPAAVAGRRGLLPLASVAVAFAAADTYVVVLCLPDMMSSIGLSIDQLQEAAPIISGFLLGYVAMLPLIGRIADLRGHLPVLVGALVLFGAGSLVTAASYDLPSLVAGRFVQGIGGGGLVPVTLALVADLYPAERRAVPLGMVGAVQELGSVLGPLYGALVLAVGGWRDIFWINLAVGLLLAIALAWSSGARLSRRQDWTGIALLALLITGLMLVMRQPQSLVDSVSLGGPFVPFGGGSVWWSPIGLIVMLLAVLFVGWLVVGPKRLRGLRPLVDLRAWWAAARQADLVGAGLLAVVLAGIILAFATADPQIQVFSPAGPWLLGGSALATALFVVHTRVAARPLIPHGSLRRRPAWGAVAVSFFVGCALIAALVDIPIFARVSVYGDSQVRAALVLVEFLVALPVGALLGGLATRRMPARLVAAAGMLLSCLAFVAMAHWGLDSLHQPSSSVALLLGGLGFGLALAPVNAALLAHTPSDVHGVVSALLVVARMVGMLVGISALTTIGLRRYYAVESGIPSPAEVCGGSTTNCAAYTHLLKLAGVEQLHAIFYGAAGCALVAALLAAALLGEGRSPERRRNFSIAQD